VSAIGVVSSGVTRFNEAPPGLVGTFASNAGPTGLAFGPDGNLYVAVQPGALGYEVVRFDGSGNPLNVFAVPPLIGANISALRFGPDGNLYVALFAGTGSGAILRFDGRTGAFMGTFASTLGSPAFMTFGPDRNLYIVSDLCLCVERVDATTRQVSTIIPTLQDPGGITSGPDGLLYVIENITVPSPSGGLVEVAQVERYDLTGRAMGTFIPAVFNGKLGAATDLAFGHDGNLYVLERDSGEIVVFNGTTGTLIGVFATVPGVPTPTPLYLAFSPLVINPTPATVSNISTRGQVGAGDNVMIGGFIISGTGTKTVLVRAIGPSLSNPPINLGGALSDPTLSLFNSAQTMIAFNDNWGDAPNVSSIPQNLRPSNALESAILVSLAPGAYTAIVRGNNGATGLGLVEVYDLDSAALAKLSNISTRALVGTGDSAAIGGFVVGSAGHVVVRAIGPSLANPPFNLANALQNPTLSLFDGNGNQIAFNDDWRSTPGVDVLIALGLQPSNDVESAIIITLAPGGYTAIIRGANNTSGLALVEVFAAQ
jgi:hypothetical protein